MMRYLIITLIAIVCFTDIMHSQKLEQFTDSIISNINKRDFKKAAYFSQLSENEMNKNVTAKDTLFANYLYAKGVLQGYLSGNYNLTFLKDALKIWESNYNKNHFKIKRKKVLRIWL